MTENPGPAKRLYGAELSALCRAIDADDVILGAASADDVADGKPAPDPVRQVRELADVPSERAVFVGDTVWDLTLSSLKGGDSYGLRRETSCFIADCPPGELR